MVKKMPSKEALKDLSNRLKNAHIQFALVGSGLMAYFGCDVDINDWDLTTNAPLEKVKSAIEGLRYEEIFAQKIFATKRLFKILYMGASFDLMVDFALKTPNGEIFDVPTTITADWEGIPVGCPKLWIKVYEIMGRHNKADMLATAVRKI